MEGDFGSEHKGRRGGRERERSRGGEESGMGEKEKGGVLMNQLVVAFVVQMSPGTVAAIEACDW